MWSVAPPTQTAEALPSRSGRCCATASTAFAASSAGTPADGRRVGWDGVQGLPSGQTSRSTGALPDMRDRRRARRAARRAVRRPGEPGRGARRPPAYLAPRHRQRRARLRAASARFLDRARLRVPGSPCLVCPWPAQPADRLADQPTGDGARACTIVGTARLGWLAPCSDRSRTCAPALQELARREQPHAHLHAHPAHAHPAHVHAHAHAARGGMHACR